MEKDKKGGLAKTNKQSASVVHDALTEFDLVDIWRTFNPDDRRYTWRRKTPENSLSTRFLSGQSECRYDNTNRRYSAGL